MPLALLILVTLAAVDFRVYRIPDRINFPSMLIGFAATLVLGNIRPYTDLWRGAAVFVDPDRPAQWEQAVLRLGQFLAQNQRLNEAVDTLEIFTDYV